MSDNRELAIKLKLQKANALLGEAEVLMQNKFYATVINRLYYGCFHATKALLLTKDLTPKTHSGVINLLHLHFVQPGLFNMEQASFYSRLLQERMEEDYSDFIIEDAENTEGFIAPAKAYVSYVEGLIKKA
jgi:uncharacterized protein (UPF0332 family)